MAFLEKNIYFLVFFYFMIKLFRKKKDPEIVQIHSNLNTSFSRLGQDIDYIQSWLRHLHDKNHNLENKHHSHYEITRKEVDSLTKWIQFLNKHNMELQNYVKNLISHVDILKKRDDELIEKLNELEKKLDSNVFSLKGHLGTLERTTQGQLKDMSFTLKNDLKDHFFSFKDEFESHKEEFNSHKEKLNELSEKSLKKDVESENKTMENKEVNVQIPNEINKKYVKKVNSFEIKSTLSGSQLELLNILYESDRPLSYADLAKILNKKPKSIRNQIYELREAGIDVKSRFIGLRKKGFYLAKETKILISGR